MILHACTHENQTYVFRGHDLRGGGQADRLAAGAEDLEGPEGAAGADQVDLGEQPDQGCGRHVPGVPLPQDLRQARGDQLPAE